MNAFNLKEIGQNLMVVMVKKPAHFLDISNIQICTDILSITLIRSVMNAAVVSINNVITLNWQHTSCLAFVSSVLEERGLVSRSQHTKI